MEKRSRRSVFKISIFIVAILLIGIYIQQYFRYDHERTKLENSITLVQKHLARARVYEANPEKLRRQMEEIEDDYKKLNRMLPPVLDVEGFQNQFSSLAKSLDVAVSFKGTEIRRLDFYNEATLSMKLSGNREAVIFLMHKQHEQPRVTAIEKLFREVENKFHLDLTIYSINGSSKEKSEHQEISVEKRLCPEFKSQAWLWPFKGRITRIHYQFVNLCKETQKHTETLCLIDKLKDRIRYVEAGLKVLKELEKYCVPKLSESLGELNQVLGDFPRALHYFSWLLDHREENLGKNHPEVADVLEKMAICYRGMGKKDEAEELEKRARQIHSK
jgi:tetratricopeptide (TPR) repeat protein